MRQLVFQLGEQIVFRLLGGVARNFFEHFKLALFDGLNFFQLCVCLANLLGDLLVLLLYVVELAVEGFLLLLNAALLALHLAAAVGDFFFAFVAEAVNFFFTLQNKLLLLRLAVFYRVGYNASCLFLRAADFLFSGISSDLNTRKNAGGGADGNSDNDADDKNYYVHLPDTSLFRDFLIMLHPIKKSQGCRYILLNCLCRIFFTPLG